MGVTDLPAALLYKLSLKVLEVIISLGSADLVKEVADHIGPVRRTLHLGVELNTVKAL